MTINEYLDTPIFYEKSKVSYFVPKSANCVYLETPKVPTLTTTEINKTFEKAITQPLESPSLEELVINNYSKGNKIVILVDDNTRPNIHTRILLPLLEEKLLKFGVAKQDIRIIISTGTHTPPDDKNIQEKILQDLYIGWKDRLWVHNCDDMDIHVDLGLSSRGTPIIIDKRVAEACLVIPLSDSEYHYFAGVAGSVKLILPGVSARQTVRVNHSRIFDLKTGFKYSCRMGIIKDNICIEDIREIVQTIMEKHGIRIFVIDAIMDQGKFVNIFAGNPLTIHENALKELKKLRNVGLDEKGDLVIVAKPSVNFYQAGKGINAASHAVKPGGQIIIISKCEDGIGPSDYLETMKKVKHLSFQEAMEWVIKNKCSSTTFEIGIQNAVDLFRILLLTKGKIYHYSDLNPTLLEDVFHVKSLNLKVSLQQALREFLQEFLKRKPDGRIIVFQDFNILAINE